MAVLAILPTTIGGLFATAISLFLTYHITTLLYNVYLHPLRDYPGPFLARASVFPRIKYLVTGKLNDWILALHDEYGEVVRFGPNELSYSNADAWKDIYGHKSAGRTSMAKDGQFYTLPRHNGFGENLANASGEAHAHQRRIFSHAFSDRALKLQEPLFLTHVDKLCRMLHCLVKDDAAHKFNMVNMYNFTTFDVMGDLTFGESLHMLDDGNYHPWVASIFAAIKIGTIVQSVRRLPLLERLLPYVVPASLQKKRQEHRQFSRTRVDRRMEKTNARPDIWGLVLGEGADDTKLSLLDMYENSSLFMLAGTETTATLLSGLTYNLLQNPATMKRLAREIRESFPQESDITIEKLPTLKYMHACIEEALRMYPPVPSLLPRIVPPGGTVIAGGFVPAKTQVGVTHIAAYRNANNFRRPTEFIPERWLDETDDFVKDKKHALQPFLLGPRVCLGRNMAYHEMRLILAKVLWHFDLSLCEESQDWLTQNVYILWEKPALVCHLKPVVR